MATKLTITVPDELAKRLEPHREHMNISRVCSEALEAELKSREAHLVSLMRYEDFKKMRSEAEAIREQMVAQAGRGWQKLAQDMQRMLKDISHEIEQLEKQIPAELRATVVEPESPEPESLSQNAVVAAESEPATEKPAELPEPKTVTKKAPKVRDPEPVAAG